MEIIAWDVYIISHIIMTFISQNPETAGKGRIKKPAYMMPVFKLLK